jgi:hypothetical protein
MTTPPPPSATDAAPAEVQPAIERLGTGRVAALRASIATRRLTPSLSISPLDGLGSAEGDLAWWSGEPTRSENPAPLDWALRREIAMRLLSHAPGRRLVGIWTRPGPPEPSDGDLAWAAALRHAAAAYDGPAPVVLVVTRWGWLLLPAGAQRIWRTPRRPGRRTDVGKQRRGRG